MDILDKYPQFMDFVNLDLLNGRIFVFCHFIASTVDFSFQLNSLRGLNNGHVACNKKLSKRGKCSLKKITFNTQVQYKARDVVFFS